ncbi:hypothetical protein [Streptobacillus moniliformis]|uniref:hypothetical protein n=1 Tax=Streptobacillus moniliformis TaxID=34105 RepID=UPI0007E4481A|nr:hypothetical protein [Streptobacillus moniliformis]
MKKNEIEFNFIVKADYSKKANFYEENKQKIFNDENVQKLKKREIEKIADFKLIEFFYYLDETIRKFQQCEDENELGKIIFLFLSHNINRMNNEFNYFDLINQNIDYFEILKDYEKFKNKCLQN